MAAWGQQISPPRLFLTPPVRVRRAAPEPTDDPAARRPYTPSQRRAFMRIVEILFYDSNKVKLVVEMPDPNRYTTDHVPHLPRSLFKLFPHLAQHSNAAAPG